MSRQIVLDTETTGLEVTQGHRIIEIGGVEVIDRKLTGRHFHKYVNPGREVDAGAFEVHGISDEFLADKPTFVQVIDEFLEFVRGAELVIHNAPFDIGFLDHELSLAGDYGSLRDLCTVTDTLVIARGQFPGQKNNLDALCKRFGVDNSSRDLHGALLDAEILADVYLLMTGGQTALQLGADAGGTSDGTPASDQTGIRRLPTGRPRLRVVRASETEQSAHQHRLASINEASGGNCIWLKE